ncbi:MAG: asparagine synthetase B [Gemmatimonadota bacterium]
MRRREFLRALVVGTAGAAIDPLRVASSAARGGQAAAFLIPMDDVQPQPLRAYGVVYRALRNGGQADWLLNWRGGAFAIEHPPALDECLTRGVMTEPLDVATVRGAEAAGETFAVRLEVAPRIAVYAPPYAAPWDDAVRLALEYAEIPYDIVWDDALLGRGLAGIDWLHLHHEDFTGQYGKYGLGVRSSDWYREAVRLDTGTAERHGFPDVAALKGAVAEAVRAFVERGGFLFAMCASTETLDVTLGGSPPDPSRTLAFRDYRIETAPMGPFSTIDGHKVNTPGRLPLGAVELARFSPAVDPVAAMLTQDHAFAFPDWYGLTTSFREETLKPGVVVLATSADGLAKYVHGDHGQGTFTFLGGHDPEDPQHAVGDPATELALHPRSPGYRLILNNVLFPAAREEEKIT